MGGSVLLSLSALFFGQDTILTIIHLILMGGSALVVSFLANFGGRQKTANVAVPPTV